MEIALLLLLSWLFCSSSITRSWCWVPLPLFTGFLWVFFWWTGLGGSETTPLESSIPRVVLRLAVRVRLDLGVRGGLGWVLRAADCWDCCMWTGELWTWWMTTGEEGITSDLTVELWASGGAEVEPGWADTGGASAVVSIVGKSTLPTDLLLDESSPLWEPSVAHLQRRGKHNQNCIKIMFTAEIKASTKSFLKPGVILVCMIS